MPPETPQMTPASPTSARMAATASSTKCAGVQVPVQPHGPHQEVAQQLRFQRACARPPDGTEPRRVCGPCRPSRRSERGSVVASVSNPAGGVMTWSPWLIQQGTTCVRNRSASPTPTNSGARIQDRQVRMAVLRGAPQAAPRRQADTPSTAARNRCPGSGIPRS